MLDNFKTMLNAKTLLIVMGMAFVMFLTRGSHSLTPVSLPDASIVLFLLGGLLLGRAAWFVALFLLASFIDFGVAAFDPTQGFCLTDGYWGLIPAYGVMWLGGVYLSQQQDAFVLLRYVGVTLVSSLLAFVISTQTYYLFSGRFPTEGGLLSTIQHGWHYLPAWMTSAAAYFAIVWLSVYLFKQIKPLALAKS